MSALPQPVAELLGKLIPRLASEHDGEVIATVTAIERTLKSAGLDLHALARRVTEPDKIVIVREPAERRPTRPRADTATLERWRLVLRETRFAGGGRFSPWEKDFCASVAESLGRGQAPTERQGAVLQRLHRKYAPSAGAR